MMMSIKGDYFYAICLANIQDKRIRILWQVRNRRTIGLNLSQIYIYIYFQHLNTNVMHK